MVDETLAKVFAAGRTEEEADQGDRPIRGVKKNPKQSAVRAD
jgi:hypothetical protein